MGDARIVTRAIQANFPIRAARDRFPIVRESRTVCTARRISNSAASLTCGEAYRLRCRRASEGRYDDGGGGCIHSGTLAQLQIRREDSIPKRIRKDPSPRPLHPIPPSPRLWRDSVGRGWATVELGMHRTPFHRRRREDSGRGRLHSETLARSREQWPLIHDCLLSLRLRRPTSAATFNGLWKLAVIIRISGGTMTRD